VTTTESFGAWLRRRRRALDLSQHELARQVSCARITIQKIEAGERRPSAQLATLLADQLGIDGHQRAQFLRAARSVLAVEELDAADLPLVADQPAPVTSSGRLARTSNLPTPLTPCLGRAHELTHIAALLADPACRLITLTGLGGVGKTHLALTAAVQTRPLPDGAWFIGLASLPSVELVASAIADALGLSLEPGGDMLARLGVTLHARRLLLVLDNAEHLLPGFADLTARLLRLAPDLKLLVTSRERLRLQNEHVVELAGLASPPDEGNDQLEGYSAAALLLQHAVRVRPGRSLTDADQRAVIRICHTLDGLPLALVLAASWTRLLSFPAIADQLAQDLDPGGLAPRDLPARHQSLRAVFAHSWDLLDAETRKALAALSVFHGAFSADVARVVAGVPLLVLATLQDASLVERSGEGRYTLHPLVRHFTRERLEQDAELHRLVYARHAVHAAGVLRDLSVIPTAATPQALTTDGVTIADIREAWVWAVNQHNLEMLEQLLDGLVARLVHQGWLLEGVDVLDLALRALVGSAKPPVAVRRLMHRLQLAQAHCYQRLSLPEQAERRLLQVLTSARADDDQRACADSLHGLGAVAWARGAYRQARAYVDEAMRLYDMLGERAAAVLEQSALVALMADCGEYEAARVLGAQVLAEARVYGDPVLLGIAALRMSMVEYALGDYPAAEARLRELLAMAGAADQLYMTVHLRSQLGLVLTAEGAYGEAEELLQTAVVQARELNYPFGLALTLNHLAAVQCRQGVHGSAQPLLTEALALCEAMGNRTGVVHALIYLGAVSVAGGDTGSAKDALIRGLDLSAAMEALPLVLDTVLGLAALLIDRGQTALAARALAAVRSHPATRALTRADAANLCKQTEALDMLPESYTRATLDDLVALARRLISTGSDDQMVKAL
jgi:predicted ATPase/transcriptional regulator with XRE-family HTH domain